MNFQWINDTHYSDDRRKIIADLCIGDRAFSSITDWDIIEEYLCQKRKIVLVVIMPDL